MKDGDILDHPATETDIGRVLPCPICGRAARLEYSGHPGYQLPQYYDIFWCESCDTKFVSPLESSEDVYNLIYQNIDRVPGYARYDRFARTVLRQSDPLSYLADEEDSYWGVAQYLTQFREPRNTHLLEVGSGLGYLTYAISQRGYDIRGLDLSKIAVSNARRRFGDLYSCGDLFSLAASRQNEFDAVIMTELIEHVPRLRDMLAAAIALVKPGGNLVVTTPNKSASAPHALWDTDAPPVHLWWLSERSLRTLAEQLEATISFIDYTEFNRSHLVGVDSNPRMSRPTVLPVFDSNSTLLAKPHPAKSWSRRAFFRLGLDRLRRVKRARDASLQFPSNRRKTMCAVLQKKA